MATTYFSVTNCGIAYYASGPPSYTIEFYILNLYTFINNDINEIIRILMCYKGVKDARAEGL